MRQWTPPPRRPRSAGRRGCLTVTGLVVGLFGLLVVIGMITGEDNEQPRSPLKLAQVGPAGSPVSCRPAPQSVVDDVAFGLTVTGGGSLSNAQVATVEGSAGSYLVADVDGPGLDGPDELAVWWLVQDNPEDDMLGVFAIDSYAREFSAWGAAAQPGSKADDAREAREPEARAVRQQCT